jgi:hypothetical protein
LAGNRPEVAQKCLVCPEEAVSKAVASINKSRSLPFQKLYNATDFPCREEQLWGWRRLAHLLRHHVNSDLLKI